MHLLGLQQALPQSSYRSLTDCLPMMRAVKDDNELMRLTAAGSAADATYGEIVKRRFAGRLETEVAADLADLLREFGHERSTSLLLAPVPMEQIPTTRPEIA
jgi:Xaa-Pro aminopeptidase